MTTPERRTSRHKGKAGPVRIWRALLYSLAGLGAAFRNEAAFRQELALAAILVVAAVALPASPVQLALLIGPVLLVLVVELLNSAIEAAVDRISFDDHALARQAKDIGSAAVFVSMLGCAAVWGLVLYDIFG
ncbi:MAG: diacylglycerol kinase [Defluviicoccus sp.]|nr:diacylglycerol kinase [Defluviicoccus sp.]MDE0386136.1 diacylglycerol kinase [Defluviicoccus sp.]